MAKYVYPAVFEWDGNGYSICFPDIENCYTSAENLIEGMDMAQDVLCMMLAFREENGMPIPKASAIQQTAVPSGAFATLISCDTQQYQQHGRPTGQRPVRPIVVKRRGRMRRYSAFHRVARSPEE